MTKNEFSRCSDEELLALGTRDAEAFGEIYDRYEDPMLAFFRRATGRADLAADLTAEVFAAAIASAASFRPELGTARGWLFGIARHELAQSWRRGRVDAEARRRLGMEPLVLSDENLERIDRLGEAGGMDSIQLLETLPADQRAAVRARVIDGLDYTEAAHVLGCSELVVRQRVSRGLRRLRALAGPR